MTNEIEKNIVPDHVVDIFNKKYGNAFLCAVAVVGLNVLFAQINTHRRTLIICE